MGSEVIRERLAYYEYKLALEIDGWDLEESSKEGEKIVVVDARSPGACSRAHVPGPSDIPHRSMSADTTRDLDEPALVVTYCDGIGCNASTRAAANLLRPGFQVKAPIGGSTGGSGTKAPRPRARPACARSRPPAAARRLPEPERR